MYSSFETTLKQMDLEGREGTAQSAAAVNNIKNLMLIGPCIIVIVEDERPT